MAKKTAASAPAPGTKVVALHPIDQRGLVGQMRTIVLFVVRSHLDQQLLRDSLDKLIRNHLPIVGARLNPAPIEGGLEEFHYPETYPEGATLFSWSTTSIDSTLESAKLIPDTSGSNGSVVWGPCMADFLDKWTPSDWPRGREDDKFDTPLLLVHVTAYHDSTILAVNIPHALADQKGLASMLKAWLAVAQGLDPPPFIQLEPGSLDGPDLPLSELQKKGTHRHKSKGDYIRTILPFIPDMVRYREETSRLMFLPASTITSLRDRCNDELIAKHGSDHPELTNGDILSSLFAKLAFLQKSHKKKTLSLSETINARGRHPALPEDKEYLHNCPSYTTARFKFDKDTSLAEMAFYHRLAVIEGVQTSSIERSFAVTKKSFEGGYEFPVGEPGDLTYHVTNWSSVWHGIDFSPVIKDKTEATDSVANAKTPLLVFGSYKRRNNNTSRWSVPILCKADGGYWADFSATIKNMALVDDLLRRDPLLKTL